MSETTDSAGSEGLVTKRTWVDELSWYLMVMGFIGLLLAGLCFFFYRNRPLAYADFSLDANVLGKYLLLTGMASYIAGRALFISVAIKSAGVCRSADDMIAISDLRKTYRIGFFRKQVKALQGITLSVGEGDLFGFVGPNGSGKSTAIKILLGLLFADAGEAVLMGLPAGLASSRREVGYLPEQPYFYDYLTGVEFLRFYGGLSGLYGSDLRGRIADCCGRTGIQNDWLDRKLRTYSKGMLQRIGLAQALLSRPRLVVLDEPMSGLDPLGRREVRHLLQTLHQEGVTVFYSSHVLSDVEALCTRMAMLVSGTVRRQGTVDEVLAGEKETYLISVEKPIASALPKSSWRLIDPLHVECADQAGKMEFLQWALAQGLGILTVERRRASLEDVLAVEAARIV